MKIQSNIVKKSILIVLAAAAAILTAVMLALAMGADLSKMQETSHSLIAQLRPWRWLIIGSLVTFWPQIIDRLAAANNLSDERIKYGKSLRWRVLGYLVVFELVIVENVIGRLFGV